MQLMPNPIDASIEAFQTILEKIHGDKIITLQYRQTYTSDSFDISHDGKIGHHRSHKQLYANCLQKLFAFGGSLIIRQFLPVSTKTLPNGVKIPKKNLYGAFVYDSLLYGLPANSLEECYCVDLNNNPITPEEDVFYRDFPI